MRWKQPRPPRLQPKTGGYADWKQLIAITCGNSCVYCGIDDATYGGLDNFHVEHYRPKSRFVKLKNSIENLYLACAICNRFKGDDWPNEPSPSHDVVAYPDPIFVDYNSLFYIERGTCIISGVNIASRYVVERLYLNRPQLIRERRLSASLQRLDTLFEAAKTLAERGRNPAAEGALTRAALDLLQASAEALKLAISALKASPYQLADVRR